MLPLQRDRCTRLIGALCAVALVSGDPCASPPFRADKYLEFAQRQSSHESDRVRGLALEVLAAHDVLAVRDRLSAALADPSILLKFVALTHVRNTADADDLKLVRRLFASATSELRKQLRAGQPSFELIVLESLSVEVLVAAGTAADRERAARHIEDALRDKTSQMRWTMAAELVGKYALGEAAQTVRAHAADSTETLVANATLAKLDDEAAREALRKSLQDDRLAHYILSDLALVSLLQLREADLMHFLRHNRPDLRLDASRALAHVGHPEHLLRLVSTELRLPPDAETDEFSRTVGVLEAARCCGNPEFVEVLRKFVDREEHPELRLHAAWALVAIAKRAERADKN